MKRLVHTSANDVDTLVGHALDAQAIKPFRESLRSRRERKHCDLDPARKLVARTRERALHAVLQLALVPDRMFARSDERLAQRSERALRFFPGVAPDRESVI